MSQVHTWDRGFGYLWKMFHSRGEWLWEPICLNWFLKSLSSWVEHFSENPTTSISSVDVAHYDNGYHGSPLLVERGRPSRAQRRGNSYPDNHRISGAPEELVVWQNLDNFWTNVKVLSIFCQTFVQVLSMSNICQNNLNFTKFCQIIVHNLS